MVRVIPLVFGYFRCFFPNSIYSAFEVSPLDLSDMWSSAHMLVGAGDPGQETHIYPMLRADSRF